jgi:hypothetical protein
VTDGRTIKHTAIPDWESEYVTLQQYEQNTFDSCQVGPQPATMPATTPASIALTASSERIVDSLILLYSDVLNGQQWPNQH